MSCTSVLRGLLGCRRRPLLGSLVFLCVLVCFLTLVRLQSGVGKDVVQDTTDKSLGRPNKGRPGSRFSDGNEVLYARSAAPGERDATYRYLLGMNYWEQFSNALRNHFALACVADEWRARTVRPFTAHSRLYGLSNVYLDDHFNESGPAHDLGLVLDLTSMDSVLMDAGLRPSASLAEMLKFGDRELIFLHFVSAVSNKEYAIKSEETFTHIWDAFQTSSVVDCSMYPELMNLARLVTSNLNSQLGQSESAAARFITRAYLCISTSRGFNPKELGRQFSFDRGNASIVVVNWRGVGNGTALTHSSKGIHPTKRVVVTDKKCLDKRNNGKISNVQFSSSVLNAAGRFMTELGTREGEFLVVHFRSEKLVFRESRFPRLLSNCVNEALRKKNEIVVDGVRNQKLKILYFADIGAFGSETCKQCSSVVRMERLAQKYNFRLTHFSPAKYDLPADRGFVAAVEMAVMSRAGHMILVGGGSFQSQLMQRFNSRNSKRSSALTLCSNDRQARETTRRFSPPNGHNQWADE